MEQGVRCGTVGDLTKLGGITSVLPATITIEKALEKTEKLPKSCSSLTDVDSTLQGYRDTQLHELRAETQRRSDCQRRLETAPDGFGSAQTQRAPTVAAF